MSGQQGPTEGNGQASRDKLRGLSIRQLEVLSLVVKGKSDLAIALALAISPGEVEAQLNDIVRILELQRRSQIRAFWAEALREDNEIRESER